MRYLNLRNWPEDFTEVEGLLFFAQLWEEMLFTYTIDSHKLRTFNLPALCEEIIPACAQCESGVLHWRAIAALRDEILEHLKEDAVARTILSASLPGLEQKISSWNQEKPSKDLSHCCSYILTELGDAYFGELKSELARLLVTPRKKKDIRRVSSALLTELIRRGFAAPYIYHRTITFFFKSSNITSVADANVFFERFDESRKKFCVIAKSPNRGDLLAKGVKKEFMAFEESFPQEMVSVAGAYVQNPHEHGYLIFKNVAAMDPYSARRLATDRLDMISSMLRFLKHQLNESSCTDSEWLACEISEVDDSPLRSNSIPAPRNTSYTRPDVREDRIQESLKELLSPFLDDDCDGEAQERLAAALNAHSAGVKSSLPDNRFMNFWRAFETIAGSRSDRDTIQTILNCSVPILCRRYFLKLIHDLVKSLKRSVNKGWKAACVHRRESESGPEFLARLLVAPDCEPPKDELFDACARNPLLRNRLVVIQDLLLHPKAARDVLSEHESRVRWHIQRMYRVRNSIIHGSRAYPWLDLLCENLHDYFDHLFSEVVKGIMSQSHHMTIDMVFFESDMKYTAYKARLAAITGQTTKEAGAKLILFGGC